MSTILFGSRDSCTARAVIPRKAVCIISTVEKPFSYSSSAPIRIEPVQARSAARVGALLDAACQVMHEVGFEPLTTALVAERAGASIGTVYRYFPDRVAVLQAVAARSLERVTSALRTDLEREQPGMSAVHLPPPWKHFFASSAKSQGSAHFAWEMCWTFARPRGSRREC